MAIHCTDPNKIGTLTENMFNVTNTDGRNLIKAFENSINNLKAHWKGTDAYANIKDLANVYESVTELVKNLQKLIVSVNNDEVLPLQNHIVKSGGTCTIGSSLSFSLGDLSSTVALPEATQESNTTAEIVTDAETFNSFPDKFGRFVDALNEAKQNLLNNWLEGAAREEVVGAFDKFNQNVPDYTANITKVRDNLNTVAENKKQLL